MQYIILFTSYYFADKADKELTAAGIPPFLVATPPEIHDACGLALRIEAGLLEQVLAFLEDHKISRSGIYTYEKGIESQRIG
ncbi:MAG: DUF3343 domain-containing protein [Veillonella sp.]|nr:DUF3343 domain-containing protein [Veillonella sp.]